MQNASEKGDGRAKAEAAEMAASQPAGDVLEELGVDPTVGLGRSEVRTHRRRFGTNRLREARRRSAWRILLEQFKSVVLVVLLIAAALAFAVRELPEGFAVIAFVLVNALIGFTTEWRAVRSMEALREMGQGRVRVRRA